MTLKIYGIPASRAIRPIWAAEELGLPYENIALHYASEAVKAPAYLAINPNGTVPAIDDDGLLIYESLAITLHLARKHAGLGLWNGTAEKAILAGGWRGVIGDPNGFVVRPRV